MPFLILSPPHTHWFLKNVCWPWFEVQVWGKMKVRRRCKSKWNYLKHLQNNWIKLSSIFGRQSTFYFFCWCWTLPTLVRLNECICTWINIWRNKTLSWSKAEIGIQRGVNSSKIANCSSARVFSQGSLFSDDFVLLRQHKTSELFSVPLKFMVTIYSHSEEPEQEATRTLRFQLSGKYITVNNYKRSILH